MEPACPRCQGMLTWNSRHVPGLGLLGALVGLAMSGYSCDGCGPISRSELPEEVRNRLNMQSFGFVGAAGLLFFIVIAVLIAVNH